MLMLASFCEGIAEQEPAALLLIVNRWNMIGFVFSSTYHVHQYTNILISNLICDHNRHHFYNNRSNLLCNYNCHQIYDPDLLGSKVRVDISSREAIRRSEKF